MYKILWVDQNVHNAENTGYLAMFKRNLQQEKGQGCIETSDSIEDAIEKIATAVKVLIIASGSLGRYLVPKIHCLDSVVSIEIFTYNPQSHKQWA